MLNGRKKRFRENHFQHNLVRQRSGTINIIAEGDSWFDYPLCTNILGELEKLGNYNILGMDKSGDEITSMVYGKQRDRIINALNKFGSRCDYFLISAGGNDILGPAFADMINPTTPYFNKTWFYERLEIVKSSYIELINIRNRYAPNLKIVTHTYDYPITTEYRPIKIGKFFTIGPWLYPVFLKHNVLDPIIQRNIVMFMIDRFANMLSDLHHDYDGFCVVDTRGLLLGTSDWSDEIHPSRSGFKKVAQEIHNNLT